MRVISGIHRGRRLVAPEGRGTRPMTDRVRENLFNILAADCPDAVVLDLFAGSGALGLEALSRGARWCIFVERDPKAVQALDTNLRVLGLEERARLARRDALRPGTWIAPPDGEAGYTLLFCDPPYRLTADPAGRRKLATAAARLEEAGYLASDAVAMLRAKRGVDLSDAPWPGFERIEARPYGTTTLHLMRRSPDGTPSEPDEVP